MKRTNNLLIISHFFPPIKNVQSKINLSTLLTFKKWGLNPIVLSALPDSFEKDFSFNRFLKEINIKYYKGYITFSLYDKIRGFLGIPVQRNIFGGIWKTIYKEAEKIILQEDIDIVYSISSPGDSHFAALKLKQKYNFFWIVEFQDPWINNISFEAWAKDNMNSLYRNFLNKKIYTNLVKVLNSADVVLTESRGHCHILKKISNRHNIDSSKIKTCYLGIDPNVLNISDKFILNELLDKLSNKVLIGFVGNVYFGYDDRVKKFVNFLKKIDEEKYIFLSVGSPYLNYLINNIGMKNAICIEPVPFSKAISIIKQLDWGVVIPSSPININSKLFDYVGCNVPALVWGYRKDEMSMFVEENGWGLVLNMENYDSKIEFLKQKKDLKLINKAFRFNCLEPLKSILKK